MKYSTAMLKGFTKVGGRQTTGELARNEYGRALKGCEAPHSVCVQGAALLGASGMPSWVDPVAEDMVIGATDRFEDVYGIDPVTLNNGSRAMRGLPWEHIYGMAVAAGL